MVRHVGAAGRRDLARQVASLLCRHGLELAALRQRRPVAGGVGLAEHHGQYVDPMVAQFGRATVAAYMRHVQDNAEESVRRVITALHDGAFTLALDNGAQISVAIRVDAQARSAEIDFTEGLEGSQFVIKNPNATSTCGCGSSFSV